MKKVKVKPSKKDLKVHNPERARFLKEEGELVDLTVYWKRMIKCGDVVLVEEKSEPKKESPKKVKNKKVNVQIDEESQE